MIDANIVSWSYEYFKTNLNPLMDWLRKIDYTIITSEENNYSRLNYLIIQCQYKGTDTYFAISELRENEVAITLTL